jgi:CheY-like chemotaxis protein
MYVLVVDDEPKVSGLLVDLLALSGHTVRRAEGGSEGLALLRTERFDAVILDYAMPEMTGVEVLEKLRDHPDIERLLKQAIPVLFKPFALDEFARFVEKLDARHLSLSS